MILSIMVFIFVVPAFFIVGLVTLIKMIVYGIRINHDHGLIKKEPDDEQYNIHYETAEEEQKRTAEYGYDDERWGNL